MTLALVIVACILFLLAGVNVPAGARANWIGLGLFFFALSGIWNQILK